MHNAYDDDYSSDDIVDPEEYMAAVEREADQEFLNRVEYLGNSRSIPTPVEVYAIWIELYVRQGGEIRVLNRDYVQTAYVDERGNTYHREGDTNTEIAYDNRGWSNWSPTVNVPIPAGYGSNSLTLLILPEVINQDLRHARDDWRDGWEWGHSTVMTILRSKTSESGFSVETNQRDAYSYNDVEKIRREMSLEQMLAKYGMEKHPSSEIVISNRKEVKSTTVKETPQKGIRSFLKKALSI